MFLFDAGGYLTALSRQDLSGRLEYPIGTHNNRSGLCRANRPLPQVLEGQSIQREIIVTALQMPIQPRTTELIAR
jgi:hypothetical protein